MKPENRILQASNWYHPTLGKCVGATLAVEVGLCLLEQSGSLALGKGVPVLIALATAGALLVLVLASLLVSILLSRRFQFSKCSLWAMVLAVALPCGWLATAITLSARQRMAVDVVKKLGCQVEHEPTVEGDTPWGLSRASRRPLVPLAQSPLVRFLGDDFFADVVYVDNTPFSGSIVRTFTNADMESLRAMRHLRHLTLNLNSDLMADSGVNHDVTDAGMASLKDLAELHQLTVSNGRKIGDSALGALKTMPQLRRLSFHGVPNISDAGLVNMQGLHELRSLTVTNATISGAGLENLKHLENLEELTLNDNPVSDAGLEDIEGFGNLQALSLQRTRVTDEGLRHIGKLTKLQVLTLDGTKIGDDGLRHLSGLTNLRILTLAGTQISDAGLEHLKKLCQLEQLGLDDTRVSDAGLRHFQGLTKLKVLVLSGTRVSDAGRNHLKTLNHLALLDFQGPVMIWNWDRDGAEMQ